MLFLPRWMRLMVPLPHNDERDSGDGRLFRAEQLMGLGIDGKRADQYALAATAYHLLIGSQLFPELQSRCRHQPPPQRGAAATPGRYTT
jgi:hypothetical protein